MKRMTIILLALVVFFMVTFALYEAPFSEATHLMITDGLQILPALFATISGFYTFDIFTSRSVNGKAWLLMASGMLLWFLGEVTWFIYEIILGIIEPFPSVADAFWLIGYPLIFAGIIYLWISMDSVKDRKQLVFIFISISITAAFIGYILLWPIAIDSGITPTEKFLDMAYPIGDLIVILGALVVPFIFGKGILSKSWRIIACGFLSSCIADLLFSYLTWNELYHVAEAAFLSHTTDMLWIIGYLIIAYGFYYQHWQLENI